MTPFDRSPSDLWCNMQASAISKLPSRAPRGLDGRTSAQLEASSELEILAFYHYIRKRLVCEYWGVSNSNFRETSTCCTSSSCDARRLRVVRRDTKSTHNTAKFKTTVYLFG